MADIRLGSLGERVAHQLRVRIIRGEIPAGTHLVEDALAAEYDVSRGPIRDALRLLDGEGLVRPQRRGVIVKPFTPDDVAELYSVRLAIELLSLEQSAAADGDWSTAARLVDEMRRDAKAADQHRFAEHDLEFHTEIYRLTGNERLLSMWQQLRPVFAVMLDVTNEQDRDLTPAADDHGALLDALRAGSVPAARILLAEHLDGSQQRMRRALGAD